MADAQKAADKHLEICKYPNRRYYDSTRSCHVTLEEIHTLIQDGYDIHVVDSRTGEDITGRVLAQIIIDLDPPKLGVFPVPMLHKLLRSSEQLMQDFVQKYFNQALMSFLDSQRSVEQYMRSAMGLQSSAPTVADWTKMMWAPLNPAQWPGVAPVAAPAPTEPAEAPADAKPAAPDSTAEENLRDVVQQLRREVASLRESGKHDKPRRKPRKPAAKTPRS